MRLMPLMPLWALIPLFLIIADGIINLVIVIVSLAG